VWDPLVILSLSPFLFPYRPTCPLRPPFLPPSLRRPLSPLPFSPPTPALRGGRHG
jgi:hypothetical protein